MRYAVRATAVIDVFEEAIYRFASSTLSQTGVSSGQVWHCPTAETCDWYPFSCTFAVDHSFDPASAVRVVTRPITDSANQTQILIDGGLGGGPPLRLQLTESARPLTTEGPSCLAPVGPYQVRFGPFASRTTTFGQEVYPFSGIGLVWDEGISHVTSIVGGLDGTEAAATGVRFSWPVTVTYESIAVRTERSWTFSFLEGSTFSRDLSWTTEVSGEIRLLRVQ
jgi:hypothetical protein